MTTELGSMAMVTTEICISLERYSEKTVNKLVICDEYLKKIETETNLRIEYEKKDNALFIHGRPKDVKRAYTKIHELLNYLSNSKTNTPIVDEVAEEEVKLLGKEFTDGVIFRRFDEGNILQENMPNTYVLDPIPMDKVEDEKGGISTSRMWGMKSFVEWKFAPEVIRETSRVLVAQLRRLPPGTEDYFKLEAGIGKVIFYENANNYPLDGAKFAISNFCHLKQTVSSFRKYLDTCLIEHLGATLPKLRYNKEGNTFKTIKIQHIVGHKDGNSYTNIWSLDILESGGDGDKKSRSLELNKIRVLKRSPFSATIHNPAKVFDFKLSIVANARECADAAESIHEIKERIGRIYRYSNKRGLLVNSAVALEHGYKPLVLAESRIFKETTWIRGNIKVSILEAEDGPENTFEVKLQNNCLKDHVLGSLREISLDYVIAAVKELSEAVEEIRDELNTFSRSEYPTDYPPNPIQRIADRSLYSEREARNTFDDDVGRKLRNTSPHQVKYRTTPEHTPDITTSKRFNCSLRQNLTRSPSLGDSPMLGAIKTHAMRGGGPAKDGFDLKTPVLTPIRVHPQTYPSAPNESIEPDLLGGYEDTTGTSPALSRSIRNSAINQEQIHGFASYDTQYAIEGLHIDSYHGDSYSTKPPDQPQRLPDVPDSMSYARTSRGPSKDVGHSSRNDKIDSHGTKQIDFFGSIQSSTDDCDQSVSWSPNKYHHEDGCLSEDLLLD